MSELSVIWEDKALSLLDGRDRYTRNAIREEFRRDPQKDLLLTYQSFRANLTSVEAPVIGEDQIPGWRLTTFEEGATPPFLRLEPRVEPPAGGVGAVCLYEVNYSGLAGVVRRNHPIDLTDLFLGLDLAVCASRQRPGTKVSTVFEKSAQYSRLPC